MSVLFAEGIDTDKAQVVSNEYGIDTGDVGMVTVY